MFYTWSGRNLSAFQYADGSCNAYLYNADGIRTSKYYYDADGNVTGTIKYTLDGNKIVAESRNGTNLYYLYDDTGAIMGISYGYDTYTFAKNIQGDVIGIYSGGTLVAKYEYNAYGQILSITNASGTDISNIATHIANLNPFRYRGYYYDTETGFYYLQSRYYDPVVGRFLNSDVAIGANGGIISYNLFAYCNNNPIRYADYTGCSAQEALEWWKNYGWVLPASDSVSPAMDIVCATVFVGLAIITIFEDTTDATSSYTYDYTQTTHSPMISTAVPTASVPISIEEIAVAEVANIKTANKYETDKIYYGIDLRGKTFKRVTKAMDFKETLAWITLSGLSKKFSRGSCWGVYTEQQIDAAILASFLSNGNLPEHHYEYEIGHYNHYHTTLHDLFNYFKRFHIWYGKPY